MRVSLEISSTARIVAIFRSKTKGGGPPAVLARTGDPCYGAETVVDTVRTGLTRLLQLDPAILAPITRQFQAVNNDPHHVGCETMGRGLPMFGSWPPGYMPRARLCPIFMRWLFDELTSDTDLSATVDTRHLDA